MRLIQSVYQSLLPCCLVAASIAGNAQERGAGSIVGRVLAPDGVPVVNASIALTAPDLPPRGVASAGDGSFEFRNLPSGSYILSTILPGFAPNEESVTVAVGRTSQLIIHLFLVAAQESIHVTAAPVTFDTRETSSVVNIDRDRVEELPIPSRNYLNFALLSPAVAPANPALQQLGEAISGGSFSFGGLRPVSNAVYLDGVNDNDEYTGGSRTELSPEAISDFQVVNHGFAAESGGGAGGSIDVQTRMGKNRRHGDTFVFVQNGALNGTPPLEISPYKPAENKVRAGASLGGALKRDRSFYYVAAEQEVTHGEDANDLPASTIESINTAIRGYTPMAGLALQSGFFPTTEQETELSGRADQNFTAHESLMLRYALTNSRNVRDAFNTDDLTDRSARGSSFTADNSLNGTLSSTVTEKLLNRASFELAQRRVLDRTEQSAAPGILIAGVALFGTPYSGNDRRYETHVEFADTISREWRQHFMQFGARTDHVALRARVADGAAGMFVFGNLAALQNSTPDFFTQSFGNFDGNLAENRIAGFAQDHWTIGSRLTLDYGLRYELSNLPAGFSTSTLNFSPRIGAAWTPMKTLIVRAGFGTFYDRFELSTINRIAEFDGTYASMQMLEDASAATLYQSGVIPTAPITGVAPSIKSAQPRLSNPYSEVASVSVERSLPWQATLSGEYQYVRGVHLGRSSNVNLTAPVILTTANAASIGISSPTPQQLGRPVFSTTRNNPAYDAINQFSTSANSSYNGTTITLNRQFQDDVEIMAGYTWSKTIDDASDDMEEPQNPYALRDERALSLMDQRQRFTLSGLWLIGPDLDDPADATKNAHPGLLMRAITGLEFAPIVGFTSGFRANPLVGLDSNREHLFPFAARPAGLNRNGLRTAANLDVDLRMLRMVPIANGHLDLVAESFNLLNHQNQSLLNTVFGSQISPTSQFAQPIATSTARRIQFSLDYEF